MMKKILIAILALAMFLPLFACGESSDLERNLAVKAMDNYIRKIDTAKTDNTNNSVQASGIAKPITSYSNPSDAISQAKEYEIFVQFLMYLYKNDKSLKLSQYYRDTYDDSIYVFRLNKSSNMVELEMLATSPEMNDFGKISIEYDFEKDELLSWRMIGASYFENYYFSCGIDYINGLAEYEFFNSFETETELLKEIIKSYNKIDKAKAKNKKTLLEEAINHVTYNDYEYENIVFEYYPVYIDSDFLTGKKFTFNFNPDYYFTMDFFQYNQFRLEIKEISYPSFFVEVTYELKRDDSDTHSVYNLISQEIKYIFEEEDEKSELLKTEYSQMDFSLWLNRETEDGPISIISLHNHKNIRFTNRG